ncbi:hypothetical protein ASPZODRAFT_27392 [Penicilliopsis zonata CBS 506.65]|uniref:Receptor L-domain domain-containing protein n=1 Tax=Penicilliopsis zonata CBS 506.65 TaxID=1073090 RepID=A0A1L9SC26_9EURO|nr:hypothetical protein ASPZODRAFT_27392 [Penicilliopsis zonata CBS 506.65]OJJ44755.1 hypothetical protein ASPZODRAFT_27392 [Penicilliopsis zonata CBS 506.65]
MSAIKYILPVLAAGRLALAVSCNDTVTISSQSDADDYASCTTIRADVTLSESISGDISLSGIEQITGSLSCTGASNLTSLTAASLNTIGDKFTLNGLTTLSALTMADLTSVGSIDWEALPNLQTLSFTAGVSTADSVIITNTGLTTLDGISLETVGEFSITDNTALTTVNVNELKNATSLINFAGNDNSLEVDFPNLGTGTNMTFRNVSSVLVPSLTTLSGELGFWGNTFKKFSAPNLTTTGDLVFDDNPDLTNISMPVLTTVNGGFEIIVNDKLSVISFPDLETVTGAVDFSGEFDTVSLPSLKEVKGGFNVQSTGNFTCSAFKSLRAAGAIKGTYTCKANAADPTTSDGSSGTGSSSNTTSTSSASATSSGAAVANLVANVPAMGAAAVFGALMQFAL